MKVGCHQKRTNQTFEKRLPQKKLVSHFGVGYRSVGSRPGGCSNNQLNANHITICPYIDYGGSVDSAAADGDVEDAGDEDDEGWDMITCFCGKPFAGRPMIECSGNIKHFKNMTFQEFTVIYLKIYSV